VLFVFSAELFADAFSATRMLADKVANIYSQQPDTRLVGEVNSISVANTAM